MAVNGIEIEQGSEWVTKDGKVGIIWCNDDSDYCWRLSCDDGYFYTYNNEGEYVTGDKNSEDLLQPTSVNLYNKDDLYSIDEISAAFTALDWCNLHILEHKLQELKDQEYTEYLRLKNKFEK